LEILEFGLDEKITVGKYLEKVFIILYYRLNYPSKWKIAGDRYFIPKFPFSLSTEDNFFIVILFRYHDNSSLTHFILKNQ
jgi:hypothetical protein